MDGFIVNPDNYVLARWVFLRGLGLIYLIAFASFGVQVTGLIGREGILPAERLLAGVRAALGNKGYLYYPTLAWLDSSDTALKGMCLVGAVLAALLVAGLQVTPVLVFLWVLYLSLVTVGQVFMGYQWDALLLEAGFLAIFLVPPSLAPSEAAAPPSAIILWLFRWLLFRLMFMSGVRKLASGDLTWRNLTAMTYHYETQPLPTPLAWYLHKAPAGFHKLSTLFTHLVELLVPFLFFAPRLPRMGAGLLTIALQALILTTGNYTFFNWLTIVLTAFLFDDTAFRAILPGRLANWVGQATAPAPGPWWNAILIALAVLYVGMGVLYFAIAVARNLTFVRPLQGLLQTVGALRLVNSYGLFAVMTTERPEIVIEGSDDGENWQPYEFKYKPGNLRRPPPIVAPHQPRLDWQMWFAALGGTYTANPWFLQFVERLLTQSPEVLRMLAHNPFPDAPPKYIRAVLYDYEFTTRAEKKEMGNWWRRERLGDYMPIAALTGKNQPSNRRGQNRASPD